MMKTHYMDEFRYKYYPRREIILPTNFFKTYAEDLEDDGSGGRIKQAKMLNTNVYEKMEKDDLDLTTYMIDYSHKKSRMKYYPNEVPEPIPSLSYFPVRYPKDTWSTKPRGVCPKFFM